MYSPKRRLRLFRPVGPPPFNPLSIPGSLIWLDGADQTSLVLAGNVVTQWNDKSGNGRTFSTTAGSPTYGSLTVSFPSGAVIRSNSNINLTTSTSIFVVSRLGSADGGLRTVIAFPNINGGDHSIRYSQNRLNIPTNPQDFSASYHVNGELNPSLPESAYSSPHIISSGSSQTSGSTPLSLSSTFLERFFVGDIYEVLVYTSVPTQLQRQQVEGYLAWKWGLQATLPANHPYKNIRP
jgi:hypothetical protein